MKNMDEAIAKLEKMDETERTQGEISILEQLLKKDKKIALVMVFDMLLAGVDTVRNTKISKICHIYNKQLAGF